MPVCEVHRHPDNAVIVRTKVSVVGSPEKIQLVFEPVLVCHAIRCRDCNQVLIKGANFVPALEVPLGYLSDVI